MTFTLNVHHNKVLGLTLLCPTRSSPDFLHCYLTYPLLGRGWTSAPKAWWLGWSGSLSGLKRLTQPEDKPDTDYDQTLCVWKASTENLEFRAVSYKGDEKSTRTATTRLKHTSIRKRITGRKWTKMMGNVFKHLMDVTLQCFNISDWCIQKAICAQITHHHATSSSSSL